MIVHVSQKQGGQHAESFEAISSAIAEQWLFSYCDYFIISRHRGYGRLAVAHDMTFRNTYVPTPDGDRGMWAPEKRNCTLKDNTPFSEVVTYAPGFRKAKR